MYKTVGKQQRQIDDLQKTTDNHERRINTLETQGMATPPEEESKPPLPPVPTSITVNIPEDVVRKGDLKRSAEQISEKIDGLKGMLNNIPSTTEAPEQQPPGISFEDAKRAVEDITDKRFGDVQKSMNDSKTLLNGIKSNVDRINDTHRFIFKVKLLLCVNFVLAAISIYGNIAQLKTIEHLTRVEWLYRWSRTKQKDTEEYQDFERRMLQGTKEEREGLKTKIFNLERKAPQFIYFKPSDDWQPEPPKEESKLEEKSEATSQAAENKQSEHKPLPHEQKSRLTPGEIEAIKQMRANPHIPEDAKPQLPEGYE